MLRGIAVTRRLARGLEASSVRGPAWDFASSRTGVPSCKLQRGPWPPASATRFDTGTASFLGDRSHLSVVPSATQKGRPQVRRLP